MGIISGLDKVDEFGPVFRLEQSHEKPTLPRITVRGWKARAMNEGARPGWRLHVFAWSKKRGRRRISFRHGLNVEEIREIRAAQKGFHLDPVKFARELLNRLATSIKKLGPLGFWMATCVGGVCQARHVGLAASI